MPVFIMIGYIFLSAEYTFFISRVHPFCLKGIPFLSAGYIIFLSRIHLIVNRVIFLSIGYTLFSTEYIFLSAEYTFLPARCTFFVSRAYLFSAMLFSALPPPNKKSVVSRHAYCVVYRSASSTCIIPMLPF